MGNKHWYQKYKLMHPKRYMLYSAKYRARRNGLEFNLKEDDFEIPLRCPILGVPLEYGKEKQTPNSPSLDRIDNTRGYTPDNVWVISNRANTMKSSCTREELLKFAFWIYKTYLKG